MKSVLVTFVTLISLTLAVSCGRNHNPAHTPSGEAEFMVGNLSSRSQVYVGEKYFVSTNKLFVRSEDEVSDDNILGGLGLNDVVEVVDSSSQLKGDYVQVKIIDSENEIDESDKYFVSFKYLNDEKVTVTSSSTSSGKFFIVQNLATEKMRVYERQCDGNSSCTNKMIFETELAIGEETKDGGTMTNLGSYRIKEWKKFYQDGQARYPSWWNDRYPAPPKAGKSVFTWFKKKYMPNGKGNQRGAFGWFTAIVGYESGGRIRKDGSGQWTHGTVGWGSDKKKYIKMTKKWYVNVFTDPRSHGCSRTDNESIAYIRHIVPEGTPLLKIYAKEAYFNDKSTVKTLYPVKTKQWPYILTKEKTGSIARQDVLNRGVGQSRILEEGVATLDTFPTIIDYTPGEELGKGSRRKSKVTGNIYDVDSSDMHGVFYIDIGMTKGYRHPTYSKIKVGGKRGEIVPDFMKI